MDKLYGTDGGMRRWVLVAAAVVVLVAAVGLAGASSRSSSGNMTYPNTAWASVISTEWGGYYSAYYYTGANTVRVVGYRSGTGSGGVETTPEIHWRNPNQGSRWTTLGGTAYSIDINHYASNSIRLIQYRGTEENPIYSIQYYMPVTTTPNTVSGTTDCVDQVVLQSKNGVGNYVTILEDSDGGNTYSFPIISGLDYRLLFDGAYYDFNCTGSDVTFDYDACIFVYGYTCGIDSIRLYVDDGGSWVVDEVESQFGGYANYEIQITDGKSYLISFADCGFVIHNQTFTCTGDHVHIDYDRCEYIDYSVPVNPYVPPIIIYLWTGYDYNIVVCRDESGNLIENSQLAIYDKTDGKYLQRWTDTKDGYTLLGARFDTDHDVLLTLRTFDGVFTLDTEYPANGSALVGEEDITTTNWTIPIRYNLRVFPMDQAAVPLFDVFCGLSEYAPINPQAFWGMDLGRRGYVAVTNCSGFAMCDLIAEKGGYVPYNVTALNWSSKSALVKDYRHTAVLAKE